jgi:hypothetical protein
VRLGERLPSTRLLGPGFLTGYELEFHKRSQDASGKCSIRPGGSGVHVAVYEISVADKRRLDEIEGVGCGYADAVVDVPGFSDCSTYRAEPAFVDDGLSPYEWYRELVLLGCRFHGFPDSYIARIKAVETQPDPDAERQHRHRQLLEKIRPALR